MSSIVIDLQNKSLDNSINVTELLRIAYTIASKLENEEFLSWAKFELNSYPTNDDIPDYRKFIGRIEGFNPYHGWQPILFENPEVKETVVNRTVGQSLAEIESMLASENKSDIYQLQLPPKFEKSLLDSLFVPKVALFVPRSTLVNIIESVRTIILNWSLQMEKDGILGENLQFEQKEKEISKNKTYNINNFFGDVKGAQIQQSSTSSYQTIKVVETDLEKLSDFIETLLSSIKELKIADGELGELNAEIQTIKSQMNSPKPKHGIIRESLSTIRRIIQSTIESKASQELLKIIAVLLTGSS